MISHDVLMFGGRTAGKSSILGAIYKQATSLAAGLDLMITTDHETAKPLLDRVELLRAAFKKSGDVVTVDKEGNVGREVYAMLLGRKGGDPQMEIRFIDTAGGWLNTLNRELTDLFATCRAALLVVDAVELMRGEDIPPLQARNLPDKVHHLVQQWLASNAEQRRFLCIVPVKGESWIRERGSHDAAAEGHRLLSAIREEYADVFNEAASYPDNVAVVVAPVQTAGNLIFEEYGPPLAAGDYPVERWRKLTTGKQVQGQKASGYSPLDCEQPLRHVLNFFLVQVLTEGRESRKWKFTGKIQEVLSDVDTLMQAFKVDFGARTAFDDLRKDFLDVFGQDAHFAEAVLEFAQESKKEPPFAVAQGGGLLAW